jgi:hypothetical protein
MIISDISALDERSTMSLLDGGFVMEQMVYICKPLPFVFFHKWQALHHRKELEHLWFYSFMKCNRLGCRRLRILFMCIPTFALHLVGVQNIQVGLIKIGMWILNP